MCLYCVIGEYEDAVVSILLFSLLFGYDYQVLYIYALIYVNVNVFGLGYAYLLQSEKHLVFNELHFC